MLSIVLNWLKRIPWLVVFTIAAIAAMLSFALKRISIPPRELSPYIERRASGYNPLIVDFGGWVGQTLLKLDRGAYLKTVLPRPALHYRGKMAASFSPI
jgi:hypothetical protein